MKFSISVPDDLWAQAAPADSSPSEVVQQALSEMVSRRKPKSSWGRAPNASVVEDCQNSLDTAVERLLSELRKDHEDGYRVGAVYSASKYAMSLEWFTGIVEGGDPAYVREALNDLLSNENSGFQIEVYSIGRDLGVLPPQAIARNPDTGETRPIPPPELKQAFVAGFADALLDIWDMFETESAKEAWS